MKIALLGAAGYVGRNAARELASRPEVRELLLADYNIRDAKKFAKSLSPKCTWRMADVGRDPDLGRVLEGVTAVASAVGPCAEYEKALLLSCARRGLPAASIGDGPVSEADRREIHDAFRREGAAAVSGCGMMPGWTELLAAHFLRGGRTSPPGPDVGRYLFCSLDRFGGYAFFRRIVREAGREAPPPPGAPKAVYREMRTEFLGLAAGRPSSTFRRLGGALGPLGTAGRELSAAALFWLRATLAGPSGTPASVAGVWMPRNGGGPSVAAVSDPESRMAGVLLATAVLRLAAGQGKEKGLFLLPDLLGREEAEEAARRGGGALTTGP
jgi:hypothetical protein